MIACTTTSAFTCTEDSECVGGGVEGICEPSGGCSFPDAECPSGKRYGDLAAGGIAGVCVDGDGVTSETSGETTMSSSSSTTTETTATTSSTSDTTTATCSELGAACDAASDCCDPCMACEGSLCVADVGGAGDCGPCEVCDENALCTAAGAGASCLFDCSELVWGQTESDGIVSCQRYTAAMVAGACDGESVCTVSNQKDCADAPGETIVSCDVACGKAMTGCGQGKQASEISVEMICEVDQEVSSCKAQCVDGSLSSRSCDSLGACVEGDLVSCSPFTCAMNACNTGCKNNMDCVDGFACVNSLCQDG